ncbi:MAG: sugar transferase [Clostridia bacterium]|nr:sugar transferase [Clostridia bacterium]
MQAFEKLPEKMQNESVREYYDILSRRKVGLVFKRIFDFSVALVFLLLLSPLILLVSLAIVIDSRGGVFFRQERVTTYDRHFYIYKFRTMVSDAERLGAQITVDGDNRITRVGRFLRKLHLDEVPQLFNVLKGDMSFVGTRPEVPKYVDAYTDEMLATLLLPAGITSLASIMYKDENSLISDADDVDDVYINKILPDKMKYNLEAIRKFGFFHDVGIMFKTFFSVFIKEDSSTVSKDANRVLIIAEDARSLILTRKELLEEILKNGYAIDVFIPEDLYCDTLREMGLNVFDVSFDRRSTNPFADLKLLKKYKSMTKVKYDFAVTYSIKPNIYGGMAMKKKKIPYYINVTGTGSAFYNGGLIKTIIKLLYKPSSRHAAGVFFENSEDRDTFVKSRLCKPERTHVFSGAGINTAEFEPAPFPENHIVKFLYIGRLMEEKGIEDLYPVIKKFSENHIAADFEFLGDFEDEYKASFEKFLALDNVVYHGYQTNVKDYIAASNCLILPSYHEGMANVLLEAGALARPLIVSDIAGCREAVEDGVNGYLFKVKDSAAIEKALDKFLALSLDEQRQMGQRSREHIVKNFERKNVVAKATSVMGVKKKIDQPTATARTGIPDGTSRS